MAAHSLTPRHDPEDGLQGTRHLSESHWSEGEAADGPRWGRNLSGFSKVTNARAPSMATTCDREDGALRPRAGKIFREKQKSKVFLKSCSWGRHLLRGCGAGLSSEKNQKSVGLFLWNLPGKT